MTKTKLIARQALEIEQLKLEVEKWRSTFGSAGGTPVAITGDPRGRHPHKWEEIRKLQSQIADINAAGNREAKRQCDEVQAKIDKLWAEMQAA